MIPCSFTNNIFQSLSFLVKIGTDPLNAKGPTPKDARIVNNIPTIKLKISQKRKVKLFFGERESKTILLFCIYSTSDGTLTKNLFQTRLLQK